MSDINRDKRVTNNSSLYRAVMVGRAENKMPKDVAGRILDHLADVSLEGYDPAVERRALDALTMDIINYQPPKRKAA